MYALPPNYIKCKQNDQSKSLAMHIDGRLKAIGNIVGFVIFSQPMSTNKWSNYIFETRKGNYVFVFTIKSISAGEDLLIDYNLNPFDTKKSLSWDW